MKRIFILILSLMCLSVNAQNRSDSSFTYIKSKPFKEPVFWTKLLVLNSGNTMMIEVTAPQGLKVSIYDNAGNQTITKTIPLGISTKTQYIKSILGFYEINGEAVFFYSVTDKPNSSLVRLIFNSVSAEVISQEIIAKMPALPFGSASAESYAKIDEPSFDLVKDPYGDSYTAVIYNSFASESGKRIQLIRFNGKNEQLNSAYFNAPKNYNYYRYLKCFARGKDYDYVSVYAWNKGKENAADSRFLIGKLNADGSNFQVKELSLQDDYKLMTCEIISNKKVNTIDFAISTSLKNEKETNEFQCFIQPIDPQSFTLFDSYILPFSKVSSYAKEKLNNKNDFEATVMDLQMDEDTIMHALLQQTKCNSTQFGFGILNAHDVGYMVFDNHGKELSGSATSLIYNVAASTLIGEHTPFGYMPSENGCTNEVGEAIIDTQPWYKQIRMLCTSKGYYILYNDMQENFSAPEGKKVNNVASMNDVTSMILKPGKDAVLQKGFLYGNPKSKKDCQFSNFSAGCYNEKTNTYETIATDIINKRQSCIVWIKF